MAQRYKVTAPGPVKESLHDLMQKALQRGMYDAVVAAAKTIAQRLQADPLAFGDPTFRMSALKLLMHTVIVPPLVVTYGVHEEQPHVFIREIKPLSRSGLED
jgi:hypothetical protein